MTGRVTHDRGRISVVLAVLTLAVIAVAGAGVDGGLALAGQKRAYSIAVDAARTGAQQIDLVHYRDTGQAVLDPVAAHAAAATRLEQVGAAGTVSATTTQVSVTVWRTQPTQLLNLFGVSEVTVAGTATAQVRHGVATPGDLGGQLP